MRTTLDLPDPLFRQLKAYAAEHGLTVKAVLRAAVETELVGAGRRKDKPRVRVPVLGSSEPATLNPSNAEIDDLLA